jgi:hypothetical protein
LRKSLRRPQLVFAGQQTDRAPFPPPGSLERRWANRRSSTTATLHANRWHQFLQNNKEIIAGSLEAKTLQNTNNTTAAPKLKVAATRHERAAQHPSHGPQSWLSKAHTPNFGSHRKVLDLCNRTPLNLPENRRG